MKRVLLVLFLLAGLLTVSCKDEKKASKDTVGTANVKLSDNTPAQETEKQEKPKNRCEVEGCENADEEGDTSGPLLGSRENPCWCDMDKVAAPVVLKSTGKYAAFNQAEFEVTNNSDKPIFQLGVYVYYYDKDGKQLSGSVDGEEKKNSYTFVTLPVASKQTVKTEFGFPKESEPKNIASMQYVIEQWCYGEVENETTHMCLFTSRPEEIRPMEK